VNYLKRFDFNKKSGWISVIFISIGISLIIFAAVYLFEGFGWLSAYKAEPLDAYVEVGWNWIRGAGIAFVVALILLIASFLMLWKNKAKTSISTPLFGRLDLNQSKPLLGLTLASVALVFFFNAALYRLELVKWFFAGLELNRPWYLSEAASWASAATTMLLIGILLEAAGLVLIVLAWKKKTS
jgi:hypothetical protein